MPFDDGLDDVRDDELGAALRRTADTFSTDAQALALAGAARGRRLRRRRTAAIVAGAAALAVVCGGGMAVAGLAGPARETAEVATPASVPASSRASHQADEVTADEMITLLKGLLPKGAVSQAEGMGTDSGQGASARVVYDDGHGASAIAVAVSRVSGATPSCPASAYAAEGTDCKVTRLTDGAELLRSKGYEYPDRREDTKLWAATYTSADGRQVSVTEWNAPAQKGAAVTRPSPPLTLAQLSSLATDDAWNPVLDVIEKPGGPSPSADAGPAAKQILSIVTGLLPEGVSAELPPASETFPHLTVDDGHGKSLVEINFDQWGEDGYTDGIFADATVMPDGTKVIVRQEAADKGVDGAVRWWVDTVRPDGLRVAISELNAVGYHQATTRSEPVLSVEDLKAIATSTKWAELG